MDPNDEGRIAGGPIRRLLRRQPQPLRQAASAALLGQQQEQNDGRGKEQEAVVQQVPHYGSASRTDASASIVMRFRVSSNSRRNRSRSSGEESGGTTIGGPRRKSPRVKGWGMMKRSQLAKSFFLSSRTPWERS